MGLAGELSTIGLAEVFQNLAFNHLSGTLTISQGKEKAHIALVEGRIKALALAGQKIDYVEIAAYAGVAPEESLQKAAEGKRRRTLKAFLAASGGFDEATYDSAIRNHVEDCLLPLFGWKNGSFLFEEGKVKEKLFDKEQLGCGVDLDPQAVSMEAARRHDEWQTLSSLVPGNKDILVLTDGEFEPLDKTAEQLIALIDGTRRMAEIVELSGIKQYDVLTALARLMETGRCVVAEPADLLALAARARMAGDVNLAARRFEMAIELDPRNIDTRRELVKLYEKADRKPEASRELVRLADLEAERGDMDSARQALERASILAPGNLDTLERIFRFHEARGEKKRALKAGEALAGVLIGQEMYEDALPLYERLLEENPESDALREAIANTLVHVGEIPKATQHLMMVAERAEEHGDLKHARRAYRHILTVDPEYDEAQLHLEEIDSGEARRKEERRRRIKSLLVAALLMGLFVFQLWREWHAQGLLHTAATAATVDLAKDNGDRARVAAMKRFAEIGSAHAWTRASAQARATLEALLEAELATVREALAMVPKAQTTADIEFSLGRAEAQLRRLGTIAWPDESRELWDTERAVLLKRIETLRAG